MIEDTSEVAEAVTLERTLAAVERLEEMLDADEEARRPGLVHPGRQLVGDALEDRAGARLPDRRPEPMALSRTAASAFCLSVGNGAFSRAITPRRMTSAS